MKSAQAGVPSDFSIPTSWRAEIMESARSKTLTPKVQNALTRDLVVHMYSRGEQPSRSFCQHACSMVIKY